MDRHVPPVRDVNPAFGLLRVGDLVVEELPYQMPVVHELRIGTGVVAGRTGGRDVDDFLDPAGPRRHHGDPLTEVHGLIDRVCDEQDGLARFRPDPQQLVL